MNFGYKVMWHDISASIGKHSLCLPLKLFDNYITIFMQVEIPYLTVN